MLETFSEIQRKTMFVYTDIGMDVVKKLDANGFTTQVFYQNPEDELDVAVVFRSRKTAKNATAASGGGPKMLEWTGERYLPWLEEPLIGYEHLHRYAYVTQFVSRKKVLDLACGEGYGSRLLAGTAESVVGLDIDENAVRHARNRYTRNNLQFKQGSITDIPIDGQNAFDVIVCFEALEHIQDHDKLLTEVKRLLTKEGLFIVSTPNKWAYSDEPKYENPFHVHELYLDEFTELFQKYFKQFKILGQRVYCNSNIWPVFSNGNSDLAEYIVERNPREFAFVEGDKRIPLYFIALASDAEKPINESASNLVDISNELLKQKDAAIGNLTAVHDHLEGTVRNQQQTLNQLTEALAHRDRLNQEINQALDEKGRQVAQLTEERDRLTREIKLLQVTFQGLQQVLDEKRRQVAQLTEERDRSTQEIKLLQVTFQDQQGALDEKGHQIIQLTEERDRFARELNCLQAAAEVQGQELLAIKDTLGWRGLEKYRQLREESKVIKFLHSFFTQAVKYFSKKKLETRYEATNLAESGVAPTESGVAPSDARDSASAMIALTKESQNGLSLNHHSRFLSAIKGSVLVLAHWLPTIDRTAGGLRAFSILQILREEGYKVVFGADRQKIEHVWLFGSEEQLTQYEETFIQLNIEVIYGSEAVMRHLDEKGYEYQFVVLSYPEITYQYLPVIRAYAYNAKVVYDPVDLHWLRMERESIIKDDDVLRQKAENYRQMERFNAAAADMVFAVTPEEKSQILEEVKNAQVEVIPTIHDCVESAKPLAGRKNLLFVGHYAHSPNEDAVGYFVKEIFPLIRQDIPGVVLYMVGSNITDKVKSLATENVVAVGYVPDLTPHLDGCRVFVAPLRYGAGIKGKIAQSMSFGLPVVTTSIGAEGMGLIDGEHVLIADSPDAFARAVVRLYTDDLLWERMSLNASLHIKSNFSKAVVQAKLNQIFATEVDGVGSSIAEAG
jgi:2-polyprenyl-3-methyl-5-hydroxy-6-metoxy-1,4-benzoquinol methylase/glycosyltransferase involved in cell wall biosynthesis